MFRLDDVAITDSEYDDEHYIQPLESNKL